MGGRRSLCPARRRGGTVRTGPAERQREHSAGPGDPGSHHRLAFRSDRSQDGRLQGSAEGARLLLERRGRRSPEQRAALFREVDALDRQGRGLGHEVQLKEGAHGWPAREALASQAFDGESKTKGEVEEVTSSAPLSAEELRLINAYWRAANYISVGQIYLLANPLLQEPLKLDHIKPRLLGHWGTTPGLNLIYAHANRVIKNRDLDAIYIMGPGHGGPAAVANAYLEGTYSEVYPRITRDVDGLRKLFRQFSFPGGVPSHVAAETPGSIHEGGELGYALVHAYGAAFDNPDLLVACVIGDGEAETGPLATAWHSNKFLDPAHDGAVLPILHLNGWKIANPTLLARIPRDELAQLMRGCGWEPIFVEGHEPAPMHDAMAAALDACVARIRSFQRAAREEGSTARPRWPMIVLASPKGWTGPKTVDGVRIEGTFHAHQVPLSDPRGNPGHLAMLEQWLRSYRPHELFHPGGQLKEEIAAIAPKGLRRMGANPH